MAPNHYMDLLSIADDMVAAAVAMSTAPQNYMTFIESRDKLKEILNETFNDSGGRRNNNNNNNPYDAEDRRKRL
jgi:hypothetical protein